MIGDTDQIIDARLFGSPGWWLQTRAIIARISIVQQIRLRIDPLALFSTIG